MPDNKHTWRLIGEYEMLQSLIALETEQVVDLDRDIAQETDAAALMELRQMQEQIISSALAGVLEATEEIGPCQSDT